MQAPAYRRLPVYRGSEVVAYALVDADLFDELNAARWGFCGNGSYVGRNIKRTSGRWATIMLHRLVMGVDSADRTPPPIHTNGRLPEVDHVNRDRLDNRRQNLRVVTRGANAENTSARGGSSAHRGVSWDIAHSRWKAFYGKHYLGLYESEAEAAQVAADFRLTHAAHSID